MEQLEHFAERLRADLKKNGGHQVHKQAFGDGQFCLRGRVNVAWIRAVRDGRVVPDNCFSIQVSEASLVKADLAYVADRHDDNGWHNQPAAYFHVLDGDTLSYRKALRALVSICRVSQ